MSEVSEPEKPAMRRHRYHRYYPQKRPLFITLLCLFIFIAIPISLLVSAGQFPAMSAIYGAWFPYFLVISYVLTIFSFIGLWRMRRWGLFLYGALFVISQPLGIWLGLPVNMAGFLVPLGIILVLCAFYKRMR